MIRYLLPFLLLLTLPANGQQVPHPAPMSLPANNAALKAINGGINLRAHRLGFAAAGDGGYAEYNWSASNCTAADDGAQVQPSVTGCWIADLSSQDSANIQIWGASISLGNNLSAIQAAFNAVKNTGICVAITGGVYKIAGTLAMSEKTCLRMAPGGKGFGPGGMLTVDLHRTCTLGIRQMTPNTDTLVVTGTSVVDGLCIDNAEITNTAGSGVILGGSTLTAPGNNLTFMNGEVVGACHGIDASGTGSHQAVATLIDNNTVIPANAVQCQALRIGKNSTGGKTTDTRIFNTQVYCHTSPLAEGMVVYDAGGLYVKQNGIVGCAHGTHFAPDLNQLVVGGEFTGTVVGDSDLDASLLIDLTHSSAKVDHVTFIATWFAPHPDNTVPAVIIKNTAGGWLGGVHFVGSSIHVPYGADGVHILAGNNITIDSSNICLRANNPGTLVYTSAGAGTALAVRDSTLGDCGLDAAIPGGPTIAAGVSLAANSDRFIVTGNSFKGVTSPISTSTYSATMHIRDNTGIDEIYPVITAAGSIAVPVQNIFRISGTGNISDMVWLGGATQRLILPTAPTFSLVTGGNICNAFTPSSIAPFIAVWDGSCWYLQ